MWFGDIVRESDALDHTQVSMTVHVHKEPVNFWGQRQQIRLFGDPSDPATSEGFRSQEPLKLCQTLLLLLLANSRWASLWHRGMRRSIKMKDQHALWETALQIPHKISLNYIIYSFYHIYCRSFLSILMIRWAAALKNIFPFRVIWRAESASFILPRFCMFLQRHGVFLFSRPIDMPTHSFNTNSTEKIIEKQINGILQSNSRHLESSESSVLGVDGDISAQKGFYRVSKRWTNACFP